MAFHRAASLRELEVSATKDLLSRSLIALEHAFVRKQLALAATDRLSAKRGQTVIPALDQRFLLSTFILAQRIILGRAIEHLVVLALGRALRAEEIGVELAVAGTQPALTLEVRALGAFSLVCGED